MSMTGDLRVIILALALLCAALAGLAVLGGLGGSRLAYAGAPGPPRGITNYELPITAGPARNSEFVIRNSRSGAPAADGTEPLPPGAIVQTVLSNMTNPVAMAFDPQGRLFYTEKTTGRVRLFENGTLQSSAVITFSTDSSGERGLLGIAVDPDFTSNHYIYVFYTCANCSTENRVARFTENNGFGSNPTTIFTSPQTAGNHNGGNIHFGPDGKLYISIGDNANEANSQNVGVKNGKMHRINPDGSIPSDNPVFTQTGAVPSLYAMGLRNSFDFTFDPLTPGRIFASENGPGCDDEMNRIEAGYNYGWRNNYSCDDNNPSPVYNTIRPLWWLGNGGGGGCCQAPTGIAVYTGDRIAEWQGHLFMASYNDSALRHFYLDGTRTGVTATNVVQGITVNTDLETGPDGALWYIQGGGYSTGTLKRITRPANTPTPSGALTSTGTPTPDVTLTPTDIPSPTTTPTATPVEPTGTSTPTPQCPPSTEGVTIENFAFAPENVTISVGATVVWTNLDLDYHTATSTGGVWDSGRIQQNETYSYTFNVPGSYSYICTPHPFMTGTITVLAGCAPTPTPTVTVTGTPTTTPTAGPLLVGHLTWQGRPQPDPRSSLAITLTLRAQTGGPTFDYAGLTTDAGGYFTMSVGTLPLGDYYWWVKNSIYLAGLGSFTLSGDAVTNVEMGTQLAGDANNNNLVDAPDFIIMRNSFGKTVGEPGYDDRADFNGDSVIGAPDFALLKGNFGLAGAPPIGPGGR